MTPADSLWIHWNVSVSHASYWTSRAWRFKTLLTLLNIYIPTYLRWAMSYKVQVQSAFGKIKLNYYDLCREGNITKSLLMLLCWPVFHLTYIFTGFELCIYSMPYGVWWKKFDNHSFKQSSVYSFIKFQPDRLVLLKDCLWFRKCCLFGLKSIQWS